ncbi:MAG: DNA polymerase III subunit gamma/tau [Parachlamydiaceae bacterium]|nr:DNA polymerase III subunit gamma/tau [Parachlamydiaceae bacterium]
MKEYQVLARKYRPQSFREVVGQEAIVTTLKNAIRRGILAHAYLFCGSRGTGKTTLARVFAKALNCLQPSADYEPCNTCASCREITSGHSLDVLEIDGASHRGIDDVRQINETVGYATASDKYKIYIIDEVHMLTKEAFNALLKTLEEPPPRVKFFFATTEPHKVLPTILSRCQRFNLNRIPQHDIIKKLGQIAKDLNVSIEEEALRMLANRAEGGLRDAESLLDQIITFHEGAITAAAVASILGMVSNDSFFALDQAGVDGNLSIAFEIAHDVFAQGKDVGHFIECLTEHFRTLLVIQMAGKDASWLTLSESDRDKYEVSSRLYSQEQCLTILDFLIEAQTNNRSASTSRISLEAILLRILRSHQRIPVDVLVRRLADLESTLKTTTPIATPAPVEKPAPAEISPPKPISAVPKAPPKSSITEDPTPAKADLPKPKKATPPPIEEKNSAPIELGSRPTEEAKASSMNQQSRYDTVMQFAAVELEGTIQKNPLKS